MMPEEDDRTTKSDGVLSSNLDRLAMQAREVLPGIRSQSSAPRTQDITASFTHHTAALPSGQLVKDDFFTLFEAVGALEIMDPKMDSGFIPKGDSFDAEFDVEAALPASQVLWVVDQLMCLEIEWLEGYPLSQTIFSCLFISKLLDPGNDQATFEADVSGNGEILVEVLTHQVLKAYCVSVIKCLELSMQVVQGQTYYEEEDFVTHLFGRDLLPKVTVEDALSMLEQAKGHLRIADALSTDLRSALEDRLVFREEMLYALRGSPMAWEHMLERMDDIKTSHKLATPAPDAFSSKVQRQLATSTPPRPMLNVSWDEASTKWRQLMSDVAEAYRLTSSATMSDPQCLQRAVWVFAYRNPPPTTLPRAILQEQLFHEQGPVATEVGHYELFLADLRNTVLAGDGLVDPASFQVELPSDPRHIRARLLESFIEKAFDEYLNLYRMVCQNRCRIRRLFTQAIAILDRLESEAERTDQAIANVPVTGKAKDTLQKGLQPLSAWVKFYELRVMAWTIQLGFETDIYMNDELGNMYWFLRTLAAGQSQLIDHVEHHLEVRMKRRPAALADCLSSRAYLHTAKIQSDVAHALASALSTLFFHLQTLNIITSPNRDFSHPQLFHEARMKPYLSITNDLIPSASDFEKARNAHNGRPTASVCRDIDAEIKHAKGLLAALKKVRPQEGKFVGAEEQWKKEIKALETTCVAVAVNASQLSRLVEKFGVEDARQRVHLVVEKRWSEWWAVPVIKENK